MNTKQKIEFPAFTGVRCLMMPYIQSDPMSVPKEYAAYSDIIRSVAVRPGSVGYLTIDESVAVAGKPHRGARAKHGRALHTEVGIIPGHGYCRIREADEAALFRPSTERHEQATLEGVA